VTPSEGALSFAIGIAGSVLAWTLTTRLRPRLSIYPHVRRRLSPFGEGYEYQVKVANAGRRGIRDFRIEAFVRFHYLVPGYPRNARSIQIVTDHDLLWLAPGSVSIVELEGGPLAPIDRRSIGNALAEQIDSRRGTWLEDLLAVGSDAALVVTVTATDAWSGIAGVNRREYRLHHVLHGRWDGGVIQLDPNPEVAGDTHGTVIGGTVDEE
jgi:hypothetical protein